MCNVHQGHAEITTAENYMIMDYIYFSKVCCGDDYCRNLIQMKNCLLVIVCDIFNEMKWNPQVFYSYPWVWVILVTFGVIYCLYFTRVASSVCYLTAGLFVVSHRNGPLSQSQRKVEPFYVYTADSEWCITIISTVLHTTGLCPIPQHSLNEQRPRTHNTNECCHFCTLFEPHPVDIIIILQIKWSFMHIKQCHVLQKK